MQYAIIQTGGKQYRVEKGAVLEIEKLSEKNGSYDFDQVLLFVDGDTVSVGKPYLSGAIVKAKILDTIKGEKIRVSKFKAKAKYRRTTGFRKIMSKVQIEGIEIKSKKVEERQ